jgi:hypothetical protein
VKPWRVVIDRQAPYAQWETIEVRDVDHLPQLAELRDILHSMPTDVCHRVTLFMGGDPVLRVEDVAEMSSHRHWVSMVTPSSPRAAQ